MDWLNAEILLFGIICALGITVIVYGIWTGKKIRRNQDIPESQLSQDPESNTTIRSTEPTERLESVVVIEARRSILREKTLSVGAHESFKKRVQEVKEIREERRHQDEKRRQQVALRIARLIIDEFQDEDLPLTQDALTLRATVERTTEERRS